MPEQPVQRRRFPRYPVDLDLTVYLPSGTVKARLIQISRGGCLVFPPLPVQPNTEVRLSFQLVDGQPSINCKAEIVYSINDRGSGVAFTEISIHNQDRITEFCEKQLAPEGSSGS
jgi:c-di-GMP-binding flagellar brake protein YcgR